VKGYRVAGKTGTSETTEDGRYIASFSAIAPSDNPVICALVVLDYPSGDSYYGGVIAAPVAGKLVEDTLNYLQVERKYTEMDKKTMVEEVSVPNVREKKIAEAKKILIEQGFECKIEGKYDESSIVVDQMPKTGAALAKKSVVVLYSKEEDKEIMVQVPELKNKSILDATYELNNLGINIKISGAGSATDQSIEAGKMVQKGTVVTVNFISAAVD
jgi:stage V sporulation protein D (sporulation-specific penicillin-binding protein)